MWWKDNLDIDFWNLMFSRKSEINWWGIGWIQMFFRQRKEYNTDSMLMFYYFYNKGEIQ